MLEEEKQFTSAYQVYSEALDEVLQEGIFDPNNSTSTPLTSKKERSPEERMRAVSIAQRLGDLVRIPGVEDSVKQSQSTSSKKSDSKDLAEKHLSWSVEELLKLSIPEETRNQILESNLGKEDPDGILLSDLELPPWVTHSELGASLESLGSLYAERGQVDFAVPLYLQALAILMPDSVAPSSVNSSTSTISKPSQSKRKPTAADRCRAAVLMNNLGQLFINGASSATSGYGPKLSKGSLDQGIAWTEKGLDIVLATQRMAGWDNRGKGEKKIVEEYQDRTQVVRSECVRAEVTLLFNLGVMAEVSFLEVVDFLSFH